MLSQVSSPLFLAPAYGRAYKTAEAMQNAWDSGLDFQVWKPGGGPYCSIRDWDKLKQMQCNVYIVDPMTDVQLQLL